MVWSNIDIELYDNEGNYAEYETPLEHFDHITDDVKTLGLSEVKKMADFPIRFPDKIEGWKRIESTGIISKNYKDEDEYHEVSGSEPDESEDYLVVVDEVPSYLDLYTNHNGQRIVVFQKYEERMTETIMNHPSGSYSYGFPKGSIILDDFEDDLAVLMDLQNNRKHLVLYHIEDDNQVTLIEIWGNVENDVMIYFAREYLKAPIN